MDSFVNRQAQSDARDAMSSLRSSLAMIVNGGIDGRMRISFRNQISSRVGALSQPVRKEGRKEEADILLANLFSHSVIAED